MQPRLNIAKSAGELIEEEVRRFFINKSTDALKNMPVREILTSKTVEHINTYYKLGENDFIAFAYKEDQDRLRLEDPNIIFNESKHGEESYIWVINFIHDYDNFCRKLPFWTLSLSIVHKKNVISSFLLNPFLDILLFSEKGSGSVNNQRKVRSNNSSEKLIYGASKRIIEPEYFSTLEKISLNSVSVELIYLSRGLIDFYLLSLDEYNHNQDCILIAKEAGIIIDTSNDCMILANESNMKKLN
jgi:fructose-1,6-bisphosphatase/inositol monophosphatase family enzyme